MIENVTAGLIGVFAEVIALLFVPKEIVLITLMFTLGTIFVLFLV